ncbi:hypothetical protein D3C71_1176610 [compost metagenome]
MKLLVLLRVQHRCFGFQRVQMLLPGCDRVLTVQSHGVEDGFPQLVYALFCRSVREYLVGPCLGRNSHDAPADFVGHNELPVFA